MTIARIVRTTILLLLASSISLSACGSPEFSRAEAALSGAGNLHVEWSVNDARDVAWCPGHGNMTIEVFPSGWFCWWECGYYEGKWQQVWLDVDVKDGKFVPADQFPVYTGACFDHSVTCPTCNFD